MGSGSTTDCMYAIDDLVQLVGDSEAANALANISQGKVGEGINAEAAFAASWLKVIQEIARGKLSPNGQKGRDRKGKGG